MLLKQDFNIGIFLKYFKLFIQKTHSAEHMQTFSSDLKTLL